MAHHNARFIQALGARCAHKIQRQHFQHGSAHDAEINRQKDQPECECGQHQMRGNVTKPRKARKARCHILKPAGGQPLQMNGEQHNRHQPEPEGRGGVENQPKRGNYRIGPAIHALGRNDPQHQPH